MLNSLVQINYCYEYLLNQIPIGLLLYSHLVPAFVALAFGAFVLYKAKNLLSFNLFVICVAFAMWCFLDLASWFSFLGSDVTMFTWSLVDLFGLVFFFFSYYFLYVFITKKDLPLVQKMVGIILVLPTVVWTFLGMNLTAFEGNYCEALESEFITAYPYFVEAIFIIAVISLIVYYYKKITDRVHKREVLLAGAGVGLFLLFFFSATLSVNLLVNYAAVDYAYNFEIYGLFGMPVLLIILAYLVVKYKAFNVKLVGAQALVVALVVLIGAQFLFIQNSASRILNICTLIAALIFGYFLVKNVKKEIESREKIEKLAGDLKKANTRLLELDKQKSEFVSFATHQLRAPLTAMKGYTSLMLEGEMGTLSKEVREAIGRIYDSSRTLTNIVDDYLNISRIELGTMKYSFDVLNLRELVDSVIGELKPNIDKSGLAFAFVQTPANPNERFMVHADKDKLKQVVANLIDNSIKYTPKGSLEVSLAKITPERKIVFSVKDTGVGIAPEVMPKLFQKFLRADNANKQNIYGTGLGLFVAKEIVLAHKGRVWAESDGEGKGSTFYLELEMAV
jgi:signal transduction histidine kinase